MAPTNVDATVTADTLIISPGRALLGINPAGCSTECTYLPVGIYETANEDIEIKVYTGASSLIAAFGAVATAALLTF